MIGFYCATPYHVFVSLHLSVTKYKDKKKNILILDHFSYASELVDNLRDTGLFENVYLLNCSTKTIEDKMKRLMKSYFVDRIVKEFSNYIYAEVLFFALDFLNYAYIIENGAQATEYAYVEDGVGTYFEDEIYSPSRIASTILKLRGKMKYISKVKTIYVFQPQMMFGNRDEFVIKKIPPVSRNNIEFTELVTKLWTFKEMDFHAMYMEQPYNEVIGAEYDTREKQIFEIIEKYFKNDELIVRIHPRSKDKFADKYKDTNYAPYEAILLNYNVEKKIIISTFSTACLTPKMMFNQEPLVILTYKLYPSFLKKYEEIDKIDAFINKFKMSYRENKYVQVPNTIEEFEEILRELRGESYDTELKK